MIVCNWVLRRRLNRPSRNPGFSGTRGKTWKSYGKGRTYLGYRSGKSSDRPDAECVALRERISCLRADRHRPRSCRARCRTHDWPHVSQSVDPLPTARKRVKICIIMITVIVYILINYIIYKRAGACCAYDDNMWYDIHVLHTRSAAAAAAAGEDLWFRTSCDSIILYVLYVRTPRENILINAYQLLLLLF